MRRAMVIDLVSDDSDEDREPRTRTSAVDDARSGRSERSEPALETLVAMGFARGEARTALEQVRLRRVRAPGDARA